MKGMAGRHSREVKAQAIIPPRTVAAVGRTLFGSHWQSPLAKALKVHDQVVRRWTNDGCPASVARPLHDLLKERAVDISNALESLSMYNAAASREE